MAAPNASIGATALGYSKHADPQKKIDTTPRPAAQVYGVAGGPAQQSITTLQQVATTSSGFNHMMSQNGMHLAVEQGKALNADVANHQAKLKHTVSSITLIARELIAQLREDISKGNPDGVKRLDQLWNELEQLYEVAQGAQDALPEYLEKQKRNSFMYHSAIVHQYYLDRKEELKIKDRKDDLQSNLILEQHQAFADYKTNTAAKLSEVETLRDRVSRLTLEKGNFRNEVDKYVKMLEQEQSVKAQNWTKLENLQREISNAVAEKVDLLSKIDTLDKELAATKEQIQLSEKSITGRFEVELKAKDDLLQKDATQIADLRDEVKLLNAKRDDYKMEIDGLKADVHELLEANEQLKAEKAKILTSNAKHLEEVATLRADIERLQQVNAELTQSNETILDLKAYNEKICKDNAELLKKIGQLTSDLATSDKDSDFVGKSLEISEDLLSKSNLKVHQMTAAIATLKEENDKLKSKIVKLQAASNGSDGDAEKKNLEEQVRQLKVSQSGLNKSLKEWTNLANASYAKYKSMMPVCKEADQLRKDALTKDGLVKHLEAEIAEIKNTSKATSTGDSAYWKEKYENLLANVSQ